MNVTELTASCMNSVQTLNDPAIAELRSDHAGETGAVYIYKGVLAVSRSPKLRAFAHEHLHTEQIHLTALEQLTPKQHRTKLLSIWRAAGWSLGAFSALIGAAFTYATVRAVETFVVQHYQQQLSLFPEPLRGLLQRFCDEEAEHRDEADSAMHAGKNYPFWEWLVGTGSRLAVQLARRF